LIEKGDSMIEARQVDEIRQLLAEGRKHHEIRRMTGVCRGAIRQIARGERPDYEALRRVRESQKRARGPGPVRRCPTCGHQVHAPCRICGVRQWMQAHRSKGPATCGGDDADGPLALELCGEELARYQEIRARRESGAQDGQTAGSSDPLDATPPAPYSPVANEAQ
jgi:hypothetical protein